MVTHSWKKKKRILTKKKNQNWIIVIIWWISGAKTCSWPCCYCSGAARSLSFWYSLGVIRGLFLHITSRKKTHHYHHPWVQWHTYLWFPPKWTRHYSRWPLSHSSACSASDLLLRVMMSIILEGVYIIILEWCIHLKSASMRHTPGCAWCWRSFDWFRLCHNMLWISNLSQVHLYCIWSLSQLSALQRAARGMVHTETVCIIHETVRVDIDQYYLCSDFVSIIDQYLPLPLKSILLRSNYTSTI